MAVAALVLGILGFILFCWLGPLLGFTWASAAMASAAFEGNPQLVVWPIWALGLTIGVGVPFVAVILGAAAMKKDESKGVAIGGLVIGCVAALGGLIITVVVTFSIKAGAAMLGGDVPDDPQVQQQIQQLQQQINDPALQEKVQQQLEQAMKQWQQQQQQPQPGQPQPGQPQPGQPQPMQPVPNQPVPMQPVQPQPAAPPSAQPLPAQPAPSPAPSQ